MDIWDVIGFCEIDDMFHELEELDDFLMGSDEDEGYDDD